MAFNPPAKMVALVGNAGVGKAKLSIFNLLLRGFMAGAYIAIGAALCTVCSTGAAPILGAGMAKLIGGAVFPVGLIAIVLTGMELFTGDCMIVPVAAMMKKVTWGAVMRNWVWVYIGNFVGSLAYAYVMVIGPFVTGQPDGTMAVNAFGDNAVGIAVAKILEYKAVGGAGLWSCFIKAIGCNFLVNIAILLAITADDIIGKFFGIWFPIMAFVATGFEHCVANMYFLPAGKFLTDWYPAVIAKKGGLLLANGGLSWGDIWFWNLIPATIGNIFGGFLFIGVTYFLMFRNDLPKD
ncbi:MAG: formate/nitrite transporter family protein [Smithellaceae bacterium]|jgi:formate/nitrite transporter|nr:formate/nitrite transporter family protein [Smithellaceae bacterium]